jgi:hypothetical protein
MLVAGGIPMLLNVARSEKQRVRLFEAAWGHTRKGAGQARVGGVMHCTPL